MEKQPLESEIEKVLEYLSYASQTDMMAQKLFFDGTETIRKQRINDPRIIESLTDIVSNNPSDSTSEEAAKTLKHLGVTPPAVKYPTIFKVRDLAVGFFGWFLAGNLIIAVIGFLLYSFLLGSLAIFAFVTLGMIIYLFSQNRKWIGGGIIAALVTNGAFMAMLGFASPFAAFLTFPMGLFLLIFLLMQ